MSILSCIQDAMLLCGLAKPTTAISSTDQSVQQFVALAQQEVDETWTDFNWRQSRIDMQITGDGSSTLWPLPTDFERLVSGEAFWSTNYPSIPLIGPISEVEMLAIKALPVTPTRPVWRLIGGAIEIWPALSNLEVVNSVYYSTNPIASSDGLTRYLRWNADSDFSMFPETILTRGLIWRWKKSKGLDYAEDFRSYQLERDKKASHEAKAKVVQMSNAYTLGPHDWPGLISVITP